MSKQAKVAAPEKQDKIPKKPSDSKKEEEKKIKVFHSLVKLYIYSRKSSGQWLIWNRVSGAHCGNW